MNIFVSATLGGLIGGIIGFIWLKKSQRNKYDERQKIQQGQSAIHTLGFAGVLLCMSSFSSELLPHWLSVSSQNILIMLLSVGFFVAEQLVRGSYFGMKFSRISLYSSIFVWVIYVILAVADTISSAMDNARLISSGTFTPKGLSLLVFWYVALLYGLIIVVWLLERRKK